MNTPHRTQVTTNSNMMCRMWGSSSLTTVLAFDFALRRLPLAARTRDASKTLMNASLNDNSSGFFAKVLWNRFNEAAPL
jgi:uncharacterized membrane protein